MIGLFFGSFNPIHKGHTTIAKEALRQTALSEIWFVVSPRNPLKETRELAPVNHRIKMVEMALKDNERMKLCDVELSLPTPSYTANTLEYLDTLYPALDFAILMGADTYEAIPRWHRAEVLLKYKKIVYPRGVATNSEGKGLSDAIWLETQLMEVSATQIRGKLFTGDNTDDELESGIREYIRAHDLYL